MKFEEWLYHSVRNVLSSCVPSTLKIQNCNVGSFIASLLYVDSRLNVNVKRLLKIDHSDPKESQVARLQRVLHSKELHNLLYQIAHLRQECHNSKSVIFHEKLLKVLKCYNFLWVQRRHDCSPVASFANCVMTLYLLKVRLQTFLSIPITQKCQILSCDTLVANERNTVMVITSRARWAGRLARMKRNVFNILAINTSRKRRLVQFRHRWDSNFQNWYEKDAARKLDLFHTNNSVMK